MTPSPDELAMVSTGFKWLAGSTPFTVAAWRFLSHDRTLLYAVFPKLGKMVDARKRQEALVVESQKAYAAEIKGLGKLRDQFTAKMIKGTSGN